MEVESDQTEDEVKLFDYLLDIIDNAMKSIQFDFEDESTLDKDEFGPIKEEYKIKYERGSTRDDKMTWKKKLKIFNYWKLCKCDISVICRCKQRSQSQMEHIFRMDVKNEERMKKIRRDVRNGGSLYDKFEQLDELLMERFEDARNGACLRVVHDDTLRIWAKEIARKLLLDEQKFNASDSWIAKFKRRHNIVSRKIVKFTSQTVEDVATIKQKAENFRAEVRSVIDNMLPDQVINSDQSSSNRMMASGRTLSHKGEQKTLAHSENISGLTHSYTLQVAMTKEKILPKVFIVCQETTGDNFGPQVSERLYSAPNLVMACSKSGKYKKKHVIEFNNDVPKPRVTGQFAYFIDSWSGHKDRTSFNMFNNDCKLFIIPAGTTSIVQPLDVFSFRPYKPCVRRFYDGIANFVDYSLYKHSLQMHQRNNYAKLHSSINNQLCNPKYNSIAKYAWSKAGLSDPYVGEYPQKVRIMFICTSQVCLNDNYGGCQYSSFVQCAYCNKSLCILHFFIKEHRHDN